MYKFLPLCDVLFNIISLVSYFCDVVFDVLTAYTLYFDEDIRWFCFALGCIFFSLIVSQICSIVWYLQELKKGKTQDCNILVIFSVHFFQAGVLFRYFRLFTPVDLRYVKKDVRDLCILRMVHAFCEAAPMLLIQLYLIWQKPSMSNLTDLNIVSTALSLFSVCWALASFNKYVREHNVHKLIMTWLGVFFQFLWRLGTITSRSLALSVYATLYGYWVLLVIILHWISMFLWLMSPKDIFHGEKMSLFKKLSLAFLIAFCYIFCFINFQESNSRRKVIAFYLTMLLENTLLISVWLGSLHSNPWYRDGVTALMFVSFLLGIIFMVLYYRHFHVRRLEHAHNMGQMNKLYTPCTGCQIGECSIKSHKQNYPTLWNELASSPNEPNNSLQMKMNNGGVVCENVSKSRSREVFSVPGVFNCRFNPVIKRKKKKPTSFVPPPAAVVNVGLVANKVGKTNQPFWKLPLPQIVNSDQENGLGKGVNIRQKLLEKKQQQVAELKKIEEEIRTGKIKKPQPNDVPNSCPVKEPIPRNKKAPWSDRCERLKNYASPGLSIIPGSKKIRSHTPEILLSPHYLENSRIYYDYQDPRERYGNNYHFPSDEMSGSLNSSSSRELKDKNNADSPDKLVKSLYKSYRVPSDLDSQISIPRSYTLPRQFKYRRQKVRQMLKVDQFLTSTNSSDGDVDSADENDPEFRLTNTDALKQLDHDPNRHSTPIFYNNHGHTRRPLRSHPVYSASKTVRLPASSHRPKLPARIQLKKSSVVSPNTHETKL